MIIGPKNTGKSTLCEYLLNISMGKSHPICILDLDPGRNRTYPASISLSTFTPGQNPNSESISIWVG